MGHMPGALLSGDQGRCDLDSEGRARVNWIEWRGGWGFGQPQVMQRPCGWRQLKGEWRWWCGVSGWQPPQALRQDCVTCVGAVVFIPENLGSHWCVESKGVNMI